MEKTRGMVRQDLSLGPACASPFHLSRSAAALQTELATRGCGFVLPSSLHAPATPPRPARYKRLWPPLAQLATFG